jgi:hypothetical protein
MDKLQIILYVGACFLAIRSLASLMSGHREQYLKKLASELAAKQRENAVPPPGPVKTDARKSKVPAKVPAANVKVPAAKAG